MVEEGMEKFSIYLAWRTIWNQALWCTSRGQKH